MKDETQEKKKKESTKNNDEIRGIVQSIISRGQLLPQTWPKGFDPDIYWLMVRTAEVRGSILARQMLSAALFSNLAEILD